jgi:hypothetical protein
MKVSVAELAGLLCLRLAVQLGAWDVLSHWRCDVRYSRHSKSSGATGWKG